MTKREADIQEQLGAEVLKRFEARREHRQARLDEVERLGTLGAAPQREQIGRVAHMSLFEGRNLEAIIGDSDLDDVSWLARGIDASRAVARIISTAGNPIGTGFLVAPGLLMTNNHVIDSVDSAAGMLAEFGFERGTDDQMGRTARFRFEASRLFVTSPDTAFDFTLLVVASTAIDRQSTIDAQGWLPLDPRPDKILEGEPIVLVEHPGGREKQVCVFHSELVDRLDQYLHYTTDSEPGSSGSPAFNRHWQVVGLHHASVPSGHRRRGAREIVNEAIRVSVILDALLTRTHVAGDCATALKLVSDPRVVGNGRVASTVTTPPAPQTRRTVEARATRIVTQPASHYRGRRGYDPDFLDSPIPLPSLTRWVAHDAAPLLSDENDYELRYTHFSTVMSKSRGMPLLTAVNIDGRTSRRLSRKDRDPDHPMTAGNEALRTEVDLEAAADQWFYDGRIDIRYQLGPEVYDATDFDFGHQVRREDPVWGEAAVAIRANDDTFHMTNCATQHKDLNQRTWVKLENAVLGCARDRKMRISVFTGPIFAPGDPEILGVKVPLAFWKIAAWTEQDGLHARGFVLFQNALVKQIQDRLEEALPGLDEVTQLDGMPIAEIARTTSIDFGPLLDVDEGKDGPVRHADESLETLLG